MRVLIHANKDDVSAYAAQHIISAINAFRPSVGHAFFVLGLPTGLATRSTHQ